MGLLPLWFTEGMAEYLSVGRVDTNTAMWLRDAVRRERLPTLKQLDDPRWFPYRYGQALWAFLSERFGDDLAARALASKAKRRRDRPARRDDGRRRGDVDARLARLAACDVRDARGANRTTRAASRLSQDGRATSGVTTSDRR